MQKVSEVYQELYHYTNAAGLGGILRTQQLWATHMAYLNDAEEHIGFFLRRLPKLIERRARKVVAEFLETGDGRKMVAEFGGPEQLIDDLQRELSKSAQVVSQGMNEPFVSSFCTDKAHATVNDGLLSQWRGYGSDGGYAIVFSAARLEEMLIEREGRAFDYQFAQFCDVDYDFPDGVEGPVHPERVVWEGEVQEVFEKWIRTRGQEPWGNLHEPMAKLSSRYKHHGFSEEHEVRIVAIPIHDGVFAVREKLIADGHKVEEPIKPRKPVKFVERRGTFVPHIELFGGAINGADGKLPILRVLVGPHPDREKRAQAVRGLVKQCGLEVSVVPSDTPYLGR